MLRISHRVVAPPLAVTLLSAAGLLTEAQSRIEAVRYWSFGDVTRIAVQTQGEYKLSSDQVEKPPRVYFDLSGLRPPPTAHRGIQTIAVGDRLVRQIRVAEVSPGKTRIVFDLEAPVEVSSSQLVNPDRLVIEIRPKGTSLPALSVSHSVTASQKIDLSSASATTNAAQDSLEPVAGEVPPTAVKASNSAETPQAFSTARTTTLQRPDGLVVQQVYAPSGNQPLAANLPATATQLPATTGPRATIASAAPVVKVPAATKVVGVASPAKRDLNGDRSLVRVFGLKLGKVVIDPGHGGHDTGTIGPNGLMEKDLVLDVALRLGKALTQRLGSQVVYTRSTDTFIPLEVRTQMANEEKADLFISIHANSSPEPSATGVETYFFNLTSDKHGLDLATRENATSASAISDLNDLLHRAVLQTKLEESREFAQRVQSSLWATSVKMNNRSRDRGVRQAPFVVLIGATMPSVLAEIGFVSNPHDARLLQRSDQRQKVAEALFKGVSAYASSLSHVQMARAGSE
jgi:N-acetylmuramoyl-L-alanine amidase